VLLLGMIMVMVLVPLMVVVVLLVTINMRRRKEVERRMCRTSNDVNLNKGVSEPWAALAY
jgi:uncharacterized membrane protein